MTYLTPEKAIVYLAAHDIVRAEIVTADGCEPQLAITVEAVDKDRNVTEATDILTATNGKFLVAEIRQTLGY